MWKKREDKTTKQNKLNNQDMLEVVLLWRSMSTVESYDNSDLMPMNMATFILMNCWCRWYKIKTSTISIFAPNLTVSTEGVWLLCFWLCTHIGHGFFFVRACLHKVSFVVTYPVCIGIYECLVNSKSITCKGTATNHPWIDWRHCQSNGISFIALCAGLLIS